MKKTLFLSFLIILIGFSSFFFFNKEFSTKKKTLPVYFSKNIENKHILFPLRRAFNKDASTLNTSLNYLLSGPSLIEKRNGYFTEIPKNTKIIEIIETEKSIIINLSKDFSFGGGTQSMTTRIKQLTYTVLDNAPNKPVYLKINNKKIKTLGGEGVEVPQPLNKNINKSLDV